MAASGGRYVRETYCCRNGTVARDYPSAWYAFDAGNTRFYVLTASWDEGKDAECSITGGNYDIALYTSQFTFDLFGDYYFSYHSSQIPDVGDHNGSNTTRFKDADMDAACDTMKNSIKTADQIAAAYTAQKVDVEKIADIGLYYRQSVRGVSTRLQNFFKNPAAVSDFWNAEDWFVTQ